MINFVFLIKAIIMGIVEGITEFLPVSSTAHLIIAANIMHFNDTNGFSTMFEVVIQLGAILAIVVLYWNKIWESLKHLSTKDWGFKLWLNVVVGCIPMGILGILLKKKIDKHLMGNVTTVAAAMIVGGILLLIIEKKFRNKFITDDINKINLRQALMVGCFQCLALWPGMSRSASTIMGGWIGGLSSAAAAEFSFFLSIPLMIAASLLDLVKANWALYDTTQIIALCIGFLVSFLVAIPVVEKFINFLKKKPMKIFAFYRILVGIILVTLIACKVM